MVFFNNANNLGEYALKILNAYYTESTLTRGVTEQQILSDVAMVFIQTIIYSTLSLFCLVNGVKRRHFRIKRHKTKHQLIKICKPPKRQKLVEFPGLDGKNDSLDLQERIEKIKLLLLLSALACINISNKIVQAKSLEYISFPTMAIVRSFRLFPTPLGVIGNEISAKATFSILISAMGIFMYVFSPEEKVEYIPFLKRLVARQDFGLLQDHDKMKLIRISLRFLYHYAQEELESFGDSAEEEKYTQTILDGKQPAQNYSLPVKEQARKYYRHLLFHYGNIKEPGKNKAAGRLFQNIVESNTAEEVDKLDPLVFSFTRMICAGKNSLYFQAFLEKRKIYAAFLLALHSWMEVALEGGQIFLCKEFGIDYEMIVTAVNLLSMSITLGILIGVSYSLSDTLAWFRKDIFISSLIFSYIRLYSMEEGRDKKIDNTRIGLQIGMKFFSLLLSVIFYGHDFNMGHILGIFFMFVGYLVNTKMHTILLSRWTLAGHLQKKCL